MGTMALAAEEAAAATMPAVILPAVALSQPKRAPTSWGSFFLRGGGKPIASALATALPCAETAESPDETEDEELLELLELSLLLSSESESGPASLLSVSSPAAFCFFLRWLAVLLGRCAFLLCFCCCGLLGSFLGLLGSFRCFGGQLFVLFLLLLRIGLLLG